jgi:hypothetical protein
LEVLASFAQFLTQTDPAVLGGPLRAAGGAGRPGARRDDRGTIGSLSSLIAPNLRSISATSSSRVT